MSIRCRPLPARAWGAQNRSMTPDRRARNDAETGVAYVSSPGVTEAHMWSFLPNCSVCAPLRWSVAWRLVSAPRLLIATFDDHMFGVSLTSLVRNLLGAPTSALGLWNERFDMRPFLVRHVARIAHMIALVFRTVLGRPHRWSSTNQAASLESHVILWTQQLSRRTLKERVFGAINCNEA
jgi:hypothetical protein